MAGDSENVKEFPDVSGKLAAPKKLSAFEKERQAAEAKRLRAEEENAAALRAFQDSFADEDDEFITSVSGGRAPPTGPRGEGPALGGQSVARYGMAPSGPRSGPGSLGAAQPPPGVNLKRKRALDEMREVHDARREQGMLGPEAVRGDGRHTPQDSAQDLEQGDDAAKPTVQVSSLPPETTAKDVEALLGGYVVVHAVHFLPPAGPGSVGSRSTSAIVMLHAETKTGQIDTAVSALKDKYLGYGFYLSISRHLSSAALHPSMAGTAAATSAEPFGAEKPKEQNRSSLRNAPPPHEHRGFAPPESYDSPVRPAYGRHAQPEALVNVQAPLNIETIRAIHILAERLLCQSDPVYAIELEAYLMARPDVQKDERFYFLYDSRSPAGVYYRYLLWGPEQGDSVAEQKRRAKGPERVYDDTIIDWLPPYEQVPFPDLTSLAQVVTDMDYVSSDEESDDDGGERRFNDMREGEGTFDAAERKHLSPVKRARLVHMLSRLPTTTARLRKGDIARVTNIAINHAGQGAEEIVDLLLLNVEKPFSYSLAAKYEEDDLDQDGEDDYEPGDSLPTLDTDSPQPQKHGKRDDDPSNAKIIALYIISDILSASSTAGARNAWKYRQLFESGFRTRKTFEHLGKLDRELAWGRLKAEQWKRKVGVVFSIWEGWSVFSSEVHEALKRSFFEPPLSEAEKAAEREAAEREEKKKAVEMLSKYKRVGQAGSPTGSASPAPVASPAAVREPEGDDVDGAPMGEDVDGAPLNDDVDGVPMEDLDGAPMDVDGAALADDGEGAAMRLDGSPREKGLAEVPVKVGLSKATTTPVSVPKPSVPKRRMRAEDMFADSDEE
ncbi:hypothetical protein LTR36_006593 [Oleoguttula mirabilis]|uniref:CID domain-containing protein n=1 Tax=Oleoguttula mirabilis TaxID=1507867 RepID=A0AAV9JBP0_9PEZI|nr:hypothetical protein LTR36_006593 [Oleoguttula mirabilis]